MKKELAAKPDTETVTKSRVIKGACLFVGQIENFTEQEWRILGESAVTDFIIIPKSTDEYNSTAEGYQTRLTPFMVETIRNLVLFNPDIKCWIGTPGITSLNFGIAAKSLDPFYQYIISIKKGLDKQIWEKNIAGIYMNEEAVYGSIDFSNINENACYKLMSDLSVKIHNQLKKEFLWVPYYGFGQYAELVTKGLAYITNKTDIFDYVVIQPHYYFNGDATENVKAVQKSIANQAISDHQGNLIFPKDSKTIIGPEMEMSWRIIPPNNFDEYNERFQQYLDAFSEYKNKYPVIFYWDGDLKKAFESQINKFFQ
uniref:hypothetical protein n=1 Tax=uncultured Draconibacterium sp. TaxID=1573823 RepID=UPI003217BF6B